MPLPLKHFGQSVNHDVQETADAEPEQAGNGDEELGLGQEFGHGKRREKGAKAPFG